MLSWLWFHEENQLLCFLGCGFMKETNFCVFLVVVSSREPAFVFSWLWFHEGNQLLYYLGCGPEQSINSSENDLFLKKRMCS